MLQQLNIKNFAIIDDLRVDFSTGFNVMTGETGAGKSIIINALSLLLGERANSSMVRHGTQRALVEGVFQLSPLIQSQLESLIGPLDEPLLVISREIDKEGRSVSRINGRITTVSTIREVMPHVIDIHSQHDSQYLLDAKSHLPLLDAFGQAQLPPIMKEYEQHYQAYASIKKEIQTLQETVFSQDQLEFFEFQLKEIQAANISEGEVETLEQEQKRIQQFEKIAEKVESALAVLGQDRGAIENLYVAKRSMEALQSDPLFESYANQLEQAHEMVQGIYESLKSDFESIDFDPDRMQVIADRIVAINRIKRKYGSTYAQIKEFEVNLIQKIAVIRDRESYLNNLLEKQAKLRKDVEKIALKLTELRKRTGVEMAQLIRKELADLYLENTQFEVIFEVLDEPQKSGLDRIEFYVSLNKGQPVKPLAKVASGGEISRFMLGLKVIFNRLFQILTMVYDEVDTGVSGKVAHSVGLKMRELATNSQIICITHLPQVAALADHHYHVRKSTNETTTFTSVELLNHSGRVKEIAKMLSGGEPTPVQLANAEELIKQKV